MFSFSPLQDFFSWISFYMEFLLFYALFYLLNEINEEEYEENEDIFCETVV